MGQQSEFRCGNAIPYLSRFHILAVRAVEVCSGVMVEVYEMDLTRVRSISVLLHVVAQTSSTLADSLLSRRLIAKRPQIFIKKLLCIVSILFFQSSSTSTRPTVSASVMLSVWVATVKVKLLLWPLAMVSQAIS